MENSGMTLAEILENDQENAKLMDEGLRKADPELIDVADEIVAVLMGLADAIAASGAYDAYNNAFNQGLREITAYPAELARMIQKAILVGETDTHDPAGDAMRGYQDGISLMARLWLLFRFQRDFHWGATDMLRRRFSSAMGYLRLQSETAALITGCKDPTFAKEWLESNSDASGQAFHHKHHPELRKTMDAWGWTSYFNLGSSHSQHSRPAGIMRGVHAASRLKGPGYIGNVYQEIGHPELMTIWYVYYLNAHGTMLPALLAAFPEADFKPLDERVGGLYRRIYRLWNSAQATYNARKNVFAREEYGILPSEK